MEKVVIVGGGMSGLMAAWVCQERGQDPVIIEPRALGGDFLMGGLKYIHKTPAMVQLLDDLDIPWADFTVKGGVLLRGKVEPYPQCLGDMDAEEAARIQADHFRKTRHMDIGTFGAKSMNDPGANKNDRRALRCDPKALIDAIAQCTEVIQAGAKAIWAEPKPRTGRFAGYVELDNGHRESFDKCIVTLPLWVLAPMCNWYIPEGVAMSLNIVRLAPMHHDPYVQWDYVYTPYTPGDAVHRISAVEGGWDAEINGSWADVEGRAMDDIAHLWPNGFRVLRQAPGLKGHLLDLSTQPAWPEAVAPLGRFAKWDPRATTDVTLEDAFKLAARWEWS